MLRTTGEIYFFPNIQGFTQSEKCLILPDLRCLFMCILETCTRTNLVNAANASKFCSFIMSFNPQTQVPVQWNAFGGTDILYNRPESFLPDSARF